MPMSYGCGAYGGSPSYNDPGEDNEEDEEKGDKEKSEAVEKPSCQVANKLSVPEKCIIVIIAIAAIAVLCSICSALF